MKIHGIFLRFFLLFNSVASAVTSYNVSVFKPAVHVLSNSGYRITKFVEHVSCVT